MNGQPMSLLLGHLESARPYGEGYRASVIPGVPA